jgi:hypothetical protein
MRSENESTTVQPTTLATRSQLPWVVLPTHIYTSRASRASWIACTSSLERLVKLMESVPCGTGFPASNLPVMMVDSVMHADGMPETRITNTQSVLSRQ